MEQCSNNEAKGFTIRVIVITTQMKLPRGVAFGSERTPQLTPLFVVRLMWTATIQQPAHRLQLQCVWKKSTPKQRTIKK